MLSRKILFCFLFISSVSQAQQNWLWSAGGAGNDEALSNAIDLHGNIYTTGYFSLNADFNQSNYIAAGAGDIFITKHDSSGNFLWTATAGGSYSDRATGITTDATGHLYITGFFSGTVSFGSLQLTSSGISPDVFVAQLDSNGNFIWAECFGGNDVDLALSIAADSTGNVYVTGQFKGTATFGTAVLISENNPVTNNSSFDIFLLKLNQSGSVRWVKQGSGKYDDRGTAVAVDRGGNCYLTGQFSDTIHFVNTYPNLFYNASFIAKIDSSGSVAWFTRMLASQLSVNGVAVNHTGVYIAGNFQGTLKFYTPSVIQAVNGFSHKYFLARLDTSGFFQWVQTGGSSNPVSVQSVAVDDSGNAYIGGTFQCRMTEFAAQYGDGVFCSAGFRDVFVAKYNSSGQQLWKRQFGGPGDDNLASIQLLSPDYPVLSGSFGTNFNIPDVGNFNANSTNFNFSTLGPAQPQVLCGDNHYNHYISLSSHGQKDVFIGCLLDLSREPYDYFDRTTGSCTRDTILPSINQGADTVSGCDFVKLYATLSTGHDGVIGPEYEYHWSNGNLLDTISATSTGWYFLHLIQKDNCRDYVDSIYAIVRPALHPQIISSGGLMEDAIPVGNCFHKLTIVYPDTVILSVPNLPSGYYYLWNTPTGISYDSTVIAYLPGVYNLSITSPDSLCTTTACLEVLLFVPVNPGSGICGLPTAFEIHLSDSIFDLTDTVRICEGDFFDLELYDSASYAQHQSWSAPVFVEWTFNGGIDTVFPQSFYRTFVYHHQSVQASTTGICTITATVIDPIYGIPYATTTFQFFLVVYDIPDPVLSGPSFLCPGDTAMLVAGSSSSYQWTGPQIIFSSFGMDTILVTQPGLYQCSFHYFDSVHGCARDEVRSQWLQGSTEPHINFNPNGIICPGDSVELVGEAGSSYTWYGPAGTVAGTNAFFVSTPGIYHYEFTDVNGCGLISESKEVIAYSSPFLSMYPSSVLCGGDSLMLFVIALDSSGIFWLPPLTGSSFTQQVNSPGTYSCSVEACGITDTISVHISGPAMQGHIIQNDTTICSGDSIQLTANAGMLSYHWFPGNVSGQFMTANNSGNYFLQAIDSNGCPSSDTIQINTFVSPPAPVVPDTIVCVGSPVILTASALGQINWFSDSLIFLQTGNQLSVDSVWLNSLFILSQTDSNSCQSMYDSVFVQTHMMQNIPLVTGAAGYCSGDSVLLHATYYSQLTYLWTGPGNVTNGNMLIVPFADTTNTGNYSLHANDQYCSYDTTVYITVFPAIIPVIPTGIEICEEDTLQLSANYFANAVYQWTGPSGFDSNLQETMIVNCTNDQAGFYVLTITMNGCSGKDSALVIIDSLPVFEIPDTTVCPELAILLEGPQGFQNYWWSNGQTSSSIVIDNSGIYILTVSDIHNCRATDTFLVSRIECEIKIQNVFTPNGDYLNDFFGLPFPDALETEMIIYDRWGKVMRTLSGENVRWDGTNEEGKKVLSGTYYWIAQLRNIAGNKRNYKGVVELIDH